MMFTRSLNYLPDGRFTDEANRWCIAYRPLSYYSERIPQDQQGMRNPEYFSTAPSWINGHFGPWVVLNT